MDYDDENKSIGPDREDGSNLWIFSIGTVVGVVGSLLLIRSNWLKMVFRRVWLRYHPVLDGEVNSSLEYNSQDPGPVGLAQNNLLERIKNTKSTVTITSTTVPATGKTPKSIKSTGIKASPSEVMPTADAAIAAASAPWDSTTRYIVGVFLFLAALVILYIGRSVIPIVIVAALIALFIDPIIKFLIRRFHIKPGLAIGFTYLFVAAMLVLIPLLAIPSLVDAYRLVTDIDLQILSARLIEAVESFATFIQSYNIIEAVLGPTVNSFLAILRDVGPTAQPNIPAPTLSVTEITSQIGRALGLVVSFLGPTMSAFVSILFTLLVSLQMTLVGDKIYTWYADLIPPGYGPELTNLTRNIRQIWTGFLRGQMTLMLVVGVMAWLGATLLGLPQALFLGVIAGVLELIPNIGPILATIPAVVLALLFGSSYLGISNWLLALLVIGVYVLIQTIENQYLVPKIMGDAVDLPPLVVLIGTVAGAGAFGILGALLATPFIATGNIIFRYAYGKIMEKPLVPPPPEEKPGVFLRVQEYISRLPGFAAQGKPASSPKDTQR